MEYYDFVSTLIRMLKIVINEMNFHIQNIYDISILITEMVRDSVRSVNYSSFVLCSYFVTLHFKRI